MIHGKKRFAALAFAALGGVAVLASCGGENHLDNAVDVATDAAGTTFALTRGDNGSFFIARADTGEAFDIRQREAIDFDITDDGGFVVAGNGPDVITWYDGVGSYIHRYPRQNEFGIVGGIAVDGSTLWVSDAKRGRVVSFDAAFEVLDVRTAGGLLNQPGAVAAGPDGAVWVYNSKADEIVLIDAADAIIVRVDAPNMNPQETPRFSSLDDGSLLWARDSDVVIVDLAGGIEVVATNLEQPNAATITGSSEVAVIDGPAPRELRLLPNDGPTDSSRAAAAVLWGVRSANANSTSTFRDPIVAVELLDTEEQQVAAGGVWRELGVVGVNEVRGIAGTVQGGAVALDLDGRVVWLDEFGAVAAVATVGGPSTVALTDVVVDPGNRVWVLDAGNARLHIVSPDDTSVELDIEAWLLGNARGLGVSPNGQVWVASTATEKIAEISQEGGLLRVVDLPGTQPTDVVVAPDGSLWVVDGGPDLVLLHLSSEGAELARYELNPFTSIESPHLAVWGNTLFVTDPGDSSMRRFDLVTNEWEADVVPLRRPADERVDLAIGVGVDDRGRLWTVDSRAAATVRLPSN